MTSDLRHGDWLGELRSAFGAGSDGVKIASPFIKQNAVARLFEGLNPPLIRVITRFNLDHFYEGVSDIAALRELLALGAEVRGVKRLHAKLYLFGEDRAVITSANLTESGFERNHELGVVAKGDSLGIACGKYFDDMWEEAGSNLTYTQLDEWQARIADAQVESPSSQMSGLGDEGADLGETEPQMPPWAEEPGKGFVKFFGKSDNRAKRSFSIFTELERGGSHWACTYPKNKRPRAPRDGDVMFMGRLVVRTSHVVQLGKPSSGRPMAERAVRSSPVIEVQPAR